MRRPQERPFGGPKLPKGLIDEASANSAKRNGRNAPTRKEQRKEDRRQKKAAHSQPRKKVVHRAAEAFEEDGVDAVEPSPSPPPTLKSKTAKVDAEAEPLKSALKESKPQTAVEDDAPAPQRPSRMVRDRLAQDDDEIAALERKLGIKSRKKRSNEDGLDDLLGDIDDAVQSEKSSKRKLAEDEEWLRQKRRKVGAPNGASDQLDDGMSDTSDAPELDGLTGLGSDFEGDSDDASSLEDLSDGEGELEDENTAGKAEDSDLDGDDEAELETENDTHEKPQKARENPYLPPTTGVQLPTAKYVPPSLRKGNDSEDESQKRLRRQIQGQVNRLSEANLLSILGSIEKVYQDNARQHVTGGLIDILMSSICDKASLSDTFLILHAAFTAAIYKVIGPDFGAQMIERIVQELDVHLANADSGKEASNVLSFLAELYTFQVVGCGIMFDYVRMLIEDLSESSTELLLRVIRMCGSSLRQDDPSSIKEIVLQVQKAAGQAGPDGLSVRQKFMIETINDLKNNRLKTGFAGSNAVAEQTTRMKKALGTLKTRNLRANEPLRITLGDIRDSEKKGKWWLVGASYHDPAKMVNGESTKKQVEVADDLPADDVTADLLQLAREQRMNTDVRRAIFVTIMSAADHKDANTRITRLKLKKSQIQEVPRVLLHCAGAEDRYNPYYTLIAKDLCTEHAIRKAFQFCLWDLFKQLGERDDAEDEEADGESSETLDMRKIVNLAKTFAALMEGGALSITSLKNLNFAYMQPQTQTFCEVLINSVFLSVYKKVDEDKATKKIGDIFGRAADVPEMLSGFRYFLKTVIAKSEITESKSQRQLITKGCKEAARVLKRSEQSQT